MDKDLIIITTPKKTIKGITTHSNFPNRSIAKDLVCRLLCVYQLIYPHVYTHAQAHRYLSLPLYTKPALCLFRRGWWNVKVTAGSDTHLLKNMYSERKLHSGFYCFYTQILTTIRI